MSPEAGEESDPVAPDRLRRALAEAIERPGSWDQLHLIVECREEQTMSSVEIWPSGVAIWNLARQFRLAADEIATLLGLLGRADFPGFEARYGGSTEDPQGDEPDPDGSGSAVIVICRIELELDGLSKSAIQLEKGEQSAALRSLAVAVLGACRDRGEAGVGAESLQDGLEKILRGDLAPEVLTLTLHRRPERPASEGDSEGFLLRIRGGSATTRAWSPPGTWGAARQLPRDEDWMASLAQALVEARVEGLPSNLFAEAYTDLVIGVLDHRKAIQARRFAGMNDETHGAFQGAFDTLYAALSELQHRIEVVGQPVLSSD